MAAIVIDAGDQNRESKEQHQTLYSCDLPLWNLEEKLSLGGGSVVEHQISKGEVLS